MSAPKDLPNASKRRLDNQRLSTSINADQKLTQHFTGIPSSPTRSFLSNRSERPSSQAFSFRESMVEPPSSLGRNNGEDTAKLIKNYLVQPEEGNDSSSIKSNDEGVDTASYSASYTLKGGAITRDIYRWQESRETAFKNRRSLSFSGLYPTSSIHESEDGQDGFLVGDMLQPGGFRRHFVHQRAIDEGRSPPNFLTRNFIDFLALYGHFAGEDYPSDEDDEQDEASAAEENSYNGSRRRFQRDIENLDDESTPLIILQKAKPTSAATASTQKCFFLLMKSFIGTGVLFLPRSFYNGGMVFSTLTLIFVAVIALYCMLLLVECYHLTGGSFGDIGKRLYGPYARYAVLGSIVFSQLGFCCAYTIFVAKNMRELVVTVTNCNINLSEGTYIFGQLLVYIPMALVRKIKYFSIAALVADVFILAGLGYIYYFDITTLATAGAANYQNFNSENFALMIGTAIFTFEGIGLVLPIAESMKEPQQFPKVLSWTVSISAFTFTSIAALCYATFGDKVDAVVLLNLPREKPMVQGVQLLYSLAITFSVPLQLFPALRILEGYFFPRGSGKSIPLIKWQKNLFRAGLCTFFAWVAFVGSASLDNFVSMIGAFACVPLCFIYPALFHLRAILPCLPRTNCRLPRPNFKWPPPDHDRRCACHLWGAYDGICKHCEYHFLVSP
ncbi:hypothetical protein DSO57_1016189 [Entomophthora muscae]|uniref:Uncharacterized protein n=1 Tax=Entomophthora muscae TaxID=34485 RepID=A0ACC2UE64_9FUNG|nr:hypothetical protein DSO57_1016189 [Entomophthora muscae]